MRFWFGAVLVSGDVEISHGQGGLRESAADSRGDRRPNDDPVLKLFSSGGADIGAI